MIKKPVLVVGVIVVVPLESIRVVKNLGRLPEADAMHFQVAADINFRNSNPCNGIYRGT